MNNIRLSTGTELTVLRAGFDCKTNDKIFLLFRYAFGDSRKPATESATLIEEIVHSQMASLV